MDILDQLLMQRLAAIQAPNTGYKQPDWAKRMFGGGIEIFPTIDLTKPDDQQPVPKSPAGKLVQDLYTLPSYFMGGLDSAMAPVGRVQDDIKYFFTGKRGGEQKYGAAPTQTPGVAPPGADLDKKAYEWFMKQGQGSPTAAVPGGPGIPGTPGARGEYKYETGYVDPRVGLPMAPTSDPSALIAAITKMVEGAKPGELPPAPVFNAPNYDAARARFEAAKPQDLTVTPEAQKFAVLSNILKGFASNPQGAGTGSFLLRGGAGGLSGLSDVEQQKMELAEKNQRARQQHNLAMGGFETKVAETGADVGNKNVEAKYNRDVASIRSSNEYKKFASQMGIEMAEKVFGIEEKNKQTRYGNEVTKYKADQQYAGDKAGSVTIQGDKIITRGLGEDGKVKIEIHPFEDQLDMLRAWKLQASLGGLGGRGGGNPSQVYRDFAVNMQKFYGKDTPQAAIAGELVLGGRGPMYLPADKWKQLEAEAQKEVMKMPISESDKMTAMQMKMINRLMQEMQSTPGLFGTLTQRMYGAQ